MGNIIEISKKDSVAGRTYMKFILHTIYSNDTEFNKNGISWQQPYVEQNSHTVRGMPLVTQFLDDEKTTPYGGHGEMNVSEGVVTFENSLVVGSFENAYVGEIEVNNKKINALIGEACVYEQRFPHLVEYMREEFENGRAVESSIEICAKKSDGNDQIIYATGYKPLGRIPENYDYSGHAILIGQTPSDDSALMIELNHYIDKNVIDGIPLEMNEVKEKLAKQVKEKVIISKKSFELNELSYDDIATIVCRAFNASMNMKEPDEYRYYYPHMFYPQSQTVIMTDYGTPQEYYKTTYNITNNDVTIGDITEVDMSWTPSNEDDTAVEINISLIEDIININKKTDKNATSDKSMKDKIMNMSDKQKTSMISGMTEDEKINMIASMSDMIKTMKKGGNTVETNETNEQLVKELNSKVEELTTKMTELNTVIVEANKTIESKEVEATQITEELNSLKAFKEAKDLESQEAEAQAKIVEINTYFETEIKKNGFSEVELNSLKTEYVDKNDLVGLKTKEAELCVKKVKELGLVEKQVELNGKDNTDLFMAIHNTEKSEEDISDLF